MDYWCVSCERKCDEKALLTANYAFDHLTPEARKQVLKVLEIDLDEGDKLFTCVQCVIDACLLGRKLGD